MPEWWTYRLSDFLMFEPETYYRLFELYNRDLWPVQILAVVAGVGLLVLIRPRGEPGTTHMPLMAAMLALAWLWIAWAFHWRRYAPINLAAGAFAAAFALQGLALAVAARRSSLVAAPPHRTDPVGFVLAGLGVLLQPLAGPLLGRGWFQMEFAGLAPDPTTTVTLGVLLATGGSPILYIVPLLWCLTTGATLWAMNAPDALLMPTVAAATMGRIVWKRIGG
jgi:hypothetical protein